MDSVPHKIMHNLTPLTIELSDFYGDGEEARHYTFRLREPSDMPKPTYGQFFMLHVPGVGEAPFTYTSVPNAEGFFRALVRRMGKVTTALFELKQGAILGARGPFGTGWPLEKFTQRRVLLVAGGCGLAPLVGLINNLIKHELCEELALIYGSRSEAAQVLNPERENWQAAIPVFDVVDDPSFIGMTGTPLDIMSTVLEEFKRAPNMIVLCGPEAMMRHVANDFTQKGFPDESIWLSIERRMHCAVGLCGHCYLEQHYACKQGPTYCWSELKNIAPNFSKEKSFIYHC